MPITTIPTNDREERFVATAGQTVFPYDFPIYAATDLLVTRLRGTTLTTLTNGTDYTVSGVENQSGGNVTLTAAAQANDIITITSAMPTGRVAQFVNGGDLPAAALESEFNRNRIYIQQLRTTLSKAIAIPPNDSAIPRLPTASARANLYLAFDGNGDPIATVPPPQTVLPSSLFNGLVFMGSGNVTLVPSHNARLIALVDTGQTLTIPTGNVFAIGQSCWLEAGERGFQIVPAEGVTLRISGTPITGSYFVPAYATALLRRSPVGAADNYHLFLNTPDLPVTNRAAAYTAALTDIGGIIRITTGGVTVPSGVFSAGQAFSIANNSASNQTITQGAGVTLRLAGTATTGNRTLAQYGLVVVSCMAPNEFFISGAGLT